MRKTTGALWLVWASTLLIFSELGNLGKLYAEEPRMEKKAEAVGPASKPALEAWEQRRVLGLGDVILALAYSPDGTRLAIAGSAGVIEIRNTKTWEIERQMNEAPRAFSLSWSPDGNRLVSGAFNSTAKVWDANTGRILLTLPGHGAAVYAVDWSPDGRRIVTGAANAVLRIWEAESGRLLRTIAGHERSITSAKWSPDSARIATADTRKVRIWAGASGDLIFTLVEGDAPAELSWSPDGTQLAVSHETSNDHRLRVWDARQGRLIRLLIGHRAGVLYVDWSPDGKRIVSGSGDMTIRIWEARTGRLERTIDLGRSQYPGVYRVVWSRDSRQLASGIAWIQIWDAETGQMVERFAESRWDVRAVRWSPDSQWVASAASGGLLLISDAQTERAVRLTGHTGMVIAVDWSPDGNWLVSGSTEDRTLRIWYVETGEAVLTINLEGDGPFSPRWSLDGRLIAYGEARRVEGEVTRMLKILDLDTGTIQTIPTRAGGAIHWSRDGTQLASAGNRYDPTLQGFIEIREVETGNLLLEILERPGFGFSAMAWSPDETKIASGVAGCEDWRCPDIKIWDAETGQLLRTIPSPAVYALSWSPDGRYIAQAAGLTVRIWEAETGQLISSLTGHVRVFDGEIIDWSPDGLWIASGATDGSVRIWGRSEASPSAEAESTDDTAALNLSSATPAPPDPNLQASHRQVQTRNNRKNLLKRLLLFPGLVSNFLRGR